METLTNEEFGAAVTEVMRDYMPGGYAERDFNYSVEYNGETGLFEVIDDDTEEVSQKFKITLQIEEVKG